MAGFSNKTLIVIAGPTAVGKTAHAIELAKHFDTEIISADSRQCYKELNIGVARPSIDELDAVPHHFIASHSIHDQLNAAWYEQYALALLNDLFSRHNVVVLTGGTGLYIKALTEGLDLIPEVPARIRNRIIQQYESEGPAWLVNELMQKDPLFASQGEMQNPQRMMRALEVMEATGQSIVSFRTGSTQSRPFRIIQIGLELPRDILYERINLRVDQMIAAGLEKEVQALIPFQDLTALQTVGYKELFAYFKNTTTIDKAIALIKQNTRRYAKRQLTWFKRQSEMKWMDASQGNIIKAIECCLNQ